MGKSKVFFTDMRTRSGNNMLDKTEKLIKAAGIEKIDFKNKFVAIKIHFGEPGNLAFIRPNYVKAIVNVIKENGGIPFLTDCNTLYTGRRANAVDHLEAAAENGFNYITTGCNVIIADGLKGTEYREIEINQKYCKTAKIGSAIADADIVISINHFKGHEMTGMGGALKNLGMGSGSRGGKLQMHSASQPKISREKCVGCGTCARNCSQGAIEIDKDKKAVIDYKKCIGCGQCVAVCRFEGAQVVWDEAGETASCKIAEYTYAVLKDKPNFHINFIMDVSPDCDCFSSNDLPIVPNIGIAASFDPVALDMACGDLVNKAPMIDGSILGEVCKDHEHTENIDKFSCIHKNTNWKNTLTYGEKIGLGNTEYELKKI